MPGDQLIINLPGFKILDVTRTDFLEIHVQYEGDRACIHCGSLSLRTKDSFMRIVRHISFGERMSRLHIKSHKFKCEDCGKYFNQRFPGIYPRKRATEKFRHEIYEDHKNGISQKRLSEKALVGQATIERWSQDHLRLAESMQDRSRWPRVLGIDEHFFTRKKGYATTFADLSKRKVFDVALGRSNKALAPYFKRVGGEDRVRVLVMDLSDTYRSIARNYFPNAQVVADRFHVVRLVNQKFLDTWKILDPSRRSNRGLISLMRRHHHKLSKKQQQNLCKYFEEVPGLESIYIFKQKLMRLMTLKSQRRHQCKSLIRVFLKTIDDLKQSGFEPLKVLGETLESWQEEIVRMWRFTKTNSITEGLHNKMEEMSRRAYGFKNFENYRLRVRVYCGYKY